MNELRIEFPDDLLQELQRESADENTAVAEIVADAVRRHFSARDQLRELQRRAALGSREAFLKFFAAAPDVEPAPEDRL